MKNYERREEMKKALSVVTMVFLCIFLVSVFAFAGVEPSPFEPSPFSPSPWKDKVLSRNWKILPDNVALFDAEMKLCYEKLAKVKQGGDVYAMEVSKSIPNMLEMAKGMSTKIIAYEESAGASANTANIKRNLNRMEQILQGLLQPQYRFDKAGIVSKLNEVQALFNQVKAGIALLK